VVKSKRIHSEINEIYNPSLDILEEVSSKLEQSKILINYWAYVENKPDNPEKQNLLRIIEEDIPQLKVELDNVSVNWESVNQDRKEMVYKEIDQLMGLYSEVMTYLPDFASYQENGGFNWFMARDMTEETGVIYEKVADINFDLKNLINQNRKQEQKALDEMVVSFQQLQFYSTYIGGFLILFGLIIGLVTARSIVTPVKSLRDKLMSMSRGVLPEMQEKPSNDEIGEMSIALNNLIQGQQRIKSFVNSIGSGDFTASYDPLSSEDELAPDFMKTRDALAENERITEQKIKERTQELREKNEQINEQSKKVTELYQDLRDSIEYAKRLQDAILPTQEQVDYAFKESFIHFKPKDIVSGDFYWIHRKDNLSYMAAVDCTGHGVPGAFMSLVGHNSIKIALSESDPTSSADIMNNLNLHATQSMNRQKESTEVRDGMDAALCIYDNDTREVRFTGALRPFFFVRKGELHTMRGSRSSIGSPDNENFQFEMETIQMQKDDVFYIFSDGYPDQFGGTEIAGRKFKMKRFKELLLDISDKPMAEQLEAIKFTMAKWQGTHAQVDDILVMGVRVN
jgi:serine phosphatase RsbU (regulator of sigma subunit)/HAMP domain-containing protein